MQVDYLIVGSGLTGGVMARLLADAGNSVLVVDRRSHVGGNVHDFVHPSGIRIHTYGPHYFRTSSRKLWDFVNQFATFYRYEAIVQSLVDGRCENWPIAREYIERTIGTNWKPEFEGRAQNFEQASLAMMPRAIYEKFVKGYSEKQWGVAAHALSAGLAGRFDVRDDNEPRLKTQEFQGIPLEGYATFTSNILRGIPVILNFDFLTDRKFAQARKLTIFTGPIDEYFDCALGRLKYRGQNRVHEYLPDVEFFQPCGQVNNPDPAGGPHIRTLEWKRMLPSEYAAQIRGTVITREITVTPDDPNNFEYPFPDEQNQLLYRRYRTLAAEEENVLFCGRLGEYRYYDMDQAIGRAMMLAERILKGERIAGNAEIESAAA